MTIWTVSYSIFTPLALIVSNPIDVEFLLQTTNYLPVSQRSKVSIEKCRVSWAARVGTGPVDLPRESYRD